MFFGRRTAELWHVLSFGCILGPVFICYLDKQWQKQLMEVVSEGLCFPCWGPVFPLGRNSRSSFWGKVGAVVFSCTVFDRICSQQKWLCERSRKEVGAVNCFGVLVHFFRGVYWGNAEPYFFSSYVCYQKYIVWVERSRKEVGAEHRLGALVNIFRGAFEGNRGSWFQVVPYY